MFAICDGSCIGNPGAGGWAFAIVDDSDDIVINYGSEKRSTNNQMELQAAINALMLYPDIDILYTDSNYLVRGITEWIKGWKMKNWQNSAKKEVLNQDLWMKLDSLVTPKIKFIWIKGHAAYKNLSHGDERFRFCLQHKVDLEARNAALALNSGTCIINRSDLNM